MKPEVRLELYDQVMSNTGIYPKARHRADGTIEERTEWQEGWNAAHIHILKKQSQIEKWYENLPPGIVDIVDHLLLNDILRVSFDKEDNVSYWILTNDIFYPGADGEEIMEEDFPVLYELNGKFGFDGIVAWISMRHGDIKPWKHDYEKFEAAKEYLNGRMGL